MKIGVIQTGRVNGALAPRFGEYPPMFEALLKPVAPEFSFETHAVVDGAPIPAPDAADGWLVTGSRHGVYDPEPWIAPLKEWLRTVRAAGRPIVGVCFGHQILAEAFGGRAIKFPGGWQIGRKSFEVRAQPGWAASLRGALDLHSVHQDQVVELPDDARVWASSPDCAHAGVIYGDAETPDAISLQPHPEFDVDFTRALSGVLVESGRIDAALGAQAVESLGAPVDASRVARAFAAYLRAAHAASRAAA